MVGNIKDMAEKGNENNIFFLIFKLIGKQIFTPFSHHIRKSVIEKLKDVKTLKDVIF